MKHVWKLVPGTRRQQYTDWGGDFCGGPTCLICEESFCIGCNPEMEGMDCDGSQITREVVEQLQVQVAALRDRLDARKLKYNEAVLEVQKWKRLADTAEVRAETELQQWLTKAITRRYQLRAVRDEVGQ